LLIIFLEHQEVCFSGSFAVTLCTFSALTLLVGRQKGHPACKKLECWDAGVVICLERGAGIRPVKNLSVGMLAWLSV